MYHKALEDAEADRPRPDYPRQVRPKWFNQHLPLNVLVGKQHPWIDLAPKRDAAAHPPDPVIAGPDQAGFWYNPSTGVFRARVPRRGSRKKTLALYNAVNRSSLSTLPGSGAPKRANGRGPVPLSLGQTVASAGVNGHGPSVRDIARTRPALSVGAEGSGSGRSNGKRSSSTASTDETAWTSDAEGGAVRSQGQSSDTERSERPTLFDQ
jgi:hypothetical protein